MILVYDMNYAVFINLVDDNIAVDITDGSEWFCAVHPCSVTLLHSMTFLMM